MAKADINDPLHGIYIPSFFILLGTLFFGLDKLVYGVILVAVLIGYRLFDMKFLKNRKILVPTEFKPFELIDQTIVSKDSAIYRFKLADEDDSIHVPLGHHIALKLKNKEEEPVRYYTPISSKYDKGFFDLLIKSYAEGDVSKQIAGLRVHQNVYFKGPVGRFVEDDYLTIDHGSEGGNKKVVMIAGGSGITPFLRIIIEAPMTMNMKLVYYSKTEKDVLLKSELDVVHEHKKTFDLSYLYGPLTGSNLSKELENIDRDSSVLICGPPGMNKEAKKAVEEMGFSHVFVF